MKKSGPFKKKGGMRGGGMAKKKTGMRRWHGKEIRPHEEKDHDEEGRHGKEVWTYEEEGHEERGYG